MKDNKALSVFGRIERVKFTPTEKKHGVKTPAFRRNCDEIYIRICKCKGKNKQIDKEIEKELLNRYKGEYEKR